MCDGVDKGGLGSEAETMCGACGAPVVNNRCSRGAEECWERSQMQKRRDAATGTKLPQLAMAVAVEWRRWHHHPEQQLIHLELIDALHAMAEHIGYPAFGPGGEDLPVEEAEREEAATGVDPSDGKRKLIVGHRRGYPSRHAAQVPVYGAVVDDGDQP